MAVKDKLKTFLTYTNAIIDTMRMSIQGDQEGMWRFSSFYDYMQKYNKLLTEIQKVVDIPAMVDCYDLQKVESPHDITPVQQKQYFDSVYMNLSILKSFLENSIGLSKSEIVNLRDFFHSNLRKAVFDTPTREVEIQNAIEQLLIGRGYTKGIDYDREAGRVKVSSKEVIPDFIFPKLDFALEVKLSKNKTKSKAIIDEINSDIRSYAKKYSNQLFLVYDLGSIRDEDEFKNDLDNEENIMVVVIKH